MTEVPAAGRLTTHVLDTALGRPAAGVRIALARLDGDDAVPVASAVTNADGRTDAPLLEGDALRAGSYELRFAVGDYLRGAGHAVGEPPFLDVVPVRFGISAPGEAHHVPLLVSPWAYSTYRGS
jgi:5-hydroxyisourate hydrolase